MTQTVERETWICPHCHETLDVTDYIRWLGRWGPFAYKEVPSKHYSEWKILILYGNGNPNEWDSYREHAHKTIASGLKVFQASSVEATT